MNKEELRDRAESAAYKLVQEEDIMEANWTIGSLGELHIKRTLTGGPPGNEVCHMWWTDLQLPPVGFWKLLMEENVL